MPKEKKDQPEMQHTMPLRREKAVISKHNVYHEEIVIHKKKIKEIKKCEVSVKREELVVERRNYVKQEDGTMEWETEKTEVIPLKQEKIHVQLIPVIKEEITIHKHKKNEIFSAPFASKKEELIVEPSGNVRSEYEEKEEME